jgi:hypothetical protein
VVEELSDYRSLWNSQSAGVKYRYDGMGNMVEWISWSNDDPSITYNGFVEYTAGRSGQAK